MIHFLGHTMLLTLPKIPFLLSFAYSMAHFLWKTLSTRFSPNHLFPSALFFCFPFQLSFFFPAFKVALSGFCLSSGLTQKKNKIHEIPRKVANWIKLPPCMGITDNVPTFFCLCLTFLMNAKEQNRIKTPNFKKGLSFGTLKKYSKKMKISLELS